MVAVDIIVIIATPNIHLLYFWRGGVIVLLLLPTINKQKPLELKRCQRGSCKPHIYPLHCFLLHFHFADPKLSVSAYLLLALKPTKQAMAVCVTIRSRK